MHLLGYLLTAGSNLLLFSSHDPALVTAVTLVVAYACQLVNVGSAYTLNYLSGTIATVSTEKSIILYLLMSYNVKYV